jgi:hypothetical protein
VGSSAFANLREHLERDFPDGSNLEAFKEEEKERIADLLDAELPRKNRSVLQFSTMNKFVNAYTRQTELRRRGVARLQRKMAKMAWRGNPWR